MKFEKINLKDVNDKIDSDQAILTCYVKDDIAEPPFLRPSVILVVGGAYRTNSKRALESVGFKFLGLGYNVFTLNYSVAPTKHPTQLHELGAAIAHLRENNEYFGIDANRVILLGFSAGGHLCGNFTNAYKEVAKALEKDESLLKPNACGLSYSVISSGEFGHQNSFSNLCGDDEVLKEKVSLEKMVTKDTCPTFLWTTATDEVVPAENSMLYAMSLSKHDVAYELHIFKDGKHGLCGCQVETVDGSLVSSHAHKWIELCHDFFQRTLNFDFLSPDFKYSKS